LAIKFVAVNPPAQLWFLEIANL